MDDMNFEALNAGTMAVPNALRQNMEDWGKLYDNAKVADAMVKANPDLEQRMGMGEGQFSTLSARDKIAATSGYMKNQGVQEMQARMKDWQAQSEERQAQAGQRTQQTQDAAAEADSLSNYARTLDAQVNNPDPNDPKAKAFADGIPDGVKYQIHAAAAAGKTNPKVAAAMIKPLMNYFGSSTAKPEPKLTVLPVGKPGDEGYHEIPVINDGHGNIQVDPAYVEEQKTKAALATQAGKSGIKFKAVPSLTADGGYATSVEADTPEGLQQGMDLLKKAGGAAGSPGTGPLPLPATNGKIDPTQLKAGAVYQTKYGPAKWDGKQFQRQ
jgi:hypothetical protein